MSCATEMRQKKNKIEPVGVPFLFTASEEVPGFSGSLNPVTALGSFWIPEAGFKDPCLSSENSMDNVFTSQFAF